MLQLLLVAKKLYPSRLSTTLRLLFARQANGKRKLVNEEDDLCVRAFHHVYDICYVSPGHRPPVLCRRVPTIRTIIGFLRGRSRRTLECGEG
jgi:hypothetical protein